jgi:hypothetical protein
MELIAMRFLALALVVCISPLPLAGQDAFHLADARTVRLEPAAFPELPQALRHDLERRGCRIPQAAADLVGPEPHNVVVGALYARKSRDGAVLCSVRDTSLILVYRGLQGAVTDSFATGADLHFLQGLGQDDIGFSRKIDLIDGRRIRAYAKSYDGPTPPATIDHLGLEHSFVGKASAVAYFFAGKWRWYQGGDENDADGGATSVHGGCGSGGMRYQSPAECPR